MPYYFDSNDVKIYPSVERSSSNTVIDIDAELITDERILRSFQECLDNGVTSFIPTSYYPWSETQDQALYQPLGVQLALDGNNDVNIIISTPPNPDSSGLDYRGNIVLYGYVVKVGSYTKTLDLSDGQTYYIYLRLNLKTKRNRLNQETYLCKGFDEVLPNYVNAGSITQQQYEDGAQADPPVYYYEFIDGKYIKVNDDLSTYPYDADKIYYIIESATFSGIELIVSTEQLTGDSLRNCVLLGIVSDRVINDNPTKILTLAEKEKYINFNDMLIKLSPTDGVSIDPVTTSRTVDDWLNNYFVIDDGDI